jgi:hypothetical protein
VGLVNIKAEYTLPEAAVVVQDKRGLIIVVQQVVMVEMAKHTQSQMDQLLFITPEAERGLEMAAMALAAKVEAVVVQELQILEAVEVQARLEVLEL